MDLTLFLAQLWGPLIFAVALGIFVSRSYYTKIYQDLEKDALAVLLFGMVAMTSGIIHVSFHNVWGTFPQIMVSLLGWGLLLKGVLFIVVPKLIDQAGDGWVNLKLIPYAGIAMFLLGGYLTWFAYFA